MKRSITLMAATLLFSAGMVAQPLSNHLYFSGSLGFGSTSQSTTQGSVTTDDFSETTFNLSPAIGYTFTDRILAGVRTNITNTSREEPANDLETKSSNFGLGVFGRYYVPIEDRFLFYPELLVGFNNGKTEITNTDNGVTVTDPSTNTFVSGVILGFAYYPSTHWGIELSTGAIGFASTTSVNETPDPDIERTTNTFGFGVDGITVNVGVSYLLQLSGN